MQQRFRVAAGLGRSCQRQVQSRLKRHPVELGRHRRVLRVAGILLVDHLRHTAKGLFHLLYRTHLMSQPVSNVLT